MTDVVQLEVTIIRTGEELGAVWAEAEGPDGHGVRLQGVDQLLGAEVEHVDDPVDGARG